MNLKHINTAAIAEARQGITGDCQADQIIRSVEYSVKGWLVGDDRESAKIARLQFQIGCLQGELRRVCRNYAEVVEPLIAEDDDSEVGAANDDNTPAWVEMEWDERRKAHEVAKQELTMRAGKLRGLPTCFGDL